MPQSRHKTPFSGKAKKEQLQAKKSRNQGRFKNSILLTPTVNKAGGSVQKLNYQSNKGYTSKQNRYGLQFFKETDQEVQSQKELARHSLEPKPESDLDINGDDYFVKELDFPKRPPWSFDLSKDTLEAKENKYFREYVMKLETEFSDISFFELNLETWRQLWRVLEMSDIILFIVDIRYPALMFPPSLYEYVTQTLQKDFILVLNKIDLAPASLVVAWKHYFQEKYPDLHIVMFTTMPGYNLVGKKADKGGLQVRKRKGRLRMAAEGTQQLFDVCNSLTGPNVDLTDWQKKIEEEMESDFSENAKIEVEENINLKSAETDYFEYEKYKQGILTIGCIGQPNVGKSSLLNSVMGKKVVSVSKTPGHTKHFQTIFLTRNVRLCDCPGLVFPSKVPKALQVLMGSFPIAQLRQPYISIKYLAEHLDLVNLLRIEHPSNDDTWCALDICDGWAKKRGYLTAHAARFDSYRAANSLLRMALDGKICLCLRPPMYSTKKDFWNKHPDIERVKWIQANIDEESSVPKLQDDGDFSDVSDEDTSAATDGKQSDADGEEEDDEETVEDDEDSDRQPIGVAVNKFAVLELDN